MSFQKLVELRNWVEILSDAVATEGLEMHKVLYDLDPIFNQHKDSLQAALLEVQKAMVLKKDVLQKKREFLALLDSTLEEQASRVTNCHKLLR